MGKDEVLDGLYLTRDLYGLPTGFVRYVNGKKVWMFGCLDGHAKVTKIEQPKVEEIKMTATVEGVKPLWTVKTDKNGICGAVGGYIDPPIRKYVMYNHQKTLRDNLALMYRGQILVGMESDGLPLQVKFDKEGRFLIQYEGKEIHATTSLTRFVALLEDKVEY